MNVAPRLTVGLPVYNGESYLAESLEALLGQTYEDFELIIADNASTDGTADICRRNEKQDSRIRYVRQPRNLGVAPNHNYVVQQARGELNGEALGSRDSRRHGRGDDEPIVGGEERVLPTHRYHITTGVGPG
jgi:glycosyltransferase involved in cell wall biosynthesis